MMKTIAKTWMVCLMLAASLTAQANVITSVGKETLEQASKVLTKVVLREGAGETGEQAARQAVRAAAKDSPQLAKVVGEVGEDALVHIVRSPHALRLITAYGDDATEIILKHGKIGEELLEFARGRRSR